MRNPSAPGPSSSTERWITVPMIPFVAFTDQVRRAIDDDPGIELVVFIDRSEQAREARDVSWRRFHEHPALPGQEGLRRAPLRREAFS